jgi:hypothetical protein
VPLKEAFIFINDLVRSERIDHVYIGALAATAHGRPRTTSDIDIVVVIHPKDIGKFLGLIEEYGLSLGERKEEIKRKLERGLPAKIPWDAAFSIDIRIATFTLDEEALSGAEDVSPRAGETFKVAPAEEIVVYKLARFARRDKGDIKGILQMQRGALDWGRIERLAKITADEAGKPEILNNLNTIKGW